MSLTKLEELGRKLEALEHAQSILHADEATNMPVGGGEKRAEAMAVLAALHHAEATAPHIGDWLEAAETEAVGEDEKAAVREFRREYVNATALSSDFVRRKAEATIRCEQQWRSLRKKGDWEAFEPALEGVVALAREEAHMRAEATGLQPYDALIEQFDPGSRVATIAPVFAALKAELVSLVPQVLARQEEKRSVRPLKPLLGPFAIEDQRALGLVAMAAIGFDFNHGRLDMSDHPFCGGVPTDVRMTTRYRTNEFLSALLAILHETGHALYEQGLPKQWSHMPLGKARGMSMHESQSLFVEMQLARSVEFWEWIMPVLREHLGAHALEGFDIEDMLAHVNHVEKGYIRVDADEVTYPLHVILRFELEQDLVSGRLGVADLPEAWDAKMTEYLGLSTLDNPADGPMQDVHWSAGLFGYFPSYTLGAMMAAQQWAALEKDIPDARAQVRNGQFETVNAWRRENIWSQGSKYTTPELLERATGKPLDASIFIGHLKRRYLA